MFTGIVENLGEVVSTKRSKGNVELEIRAKFVSSIRVDQSIAHNGVCLTVEKVNKLKGIYTVTAISETLKRTTIGNLTKGSIVNLERCMKANGRFDGHIVQGHVDITALCTNKKSMDGSWVFTFKLPGRSKNLTVEKGSICIDGVSLTVVNSIKNTFSVAIIPFTYNHTTFKNLTKGQFVNIEFDILGKYIEKFIR